MLIATNIYPTKTLANLDFTLLWERQFEDLLFSNNLVVNSKNETLLYTYDHDWDSNISKYDVMKLDASGNTIKSKQFKMVE